MLRIVSLETGRLRLAFPSQRLSETCYRPPARRILLQLLAECVLGDLQLTLLQRHRSKGASHRSRVGWRLGVTKTALGANRRLQRPERFVELLGGEVDVAIELLARDDQLLWRIVSLQLQLFQRAVHGFDFALGGPYVALRRERQPDGPMPPRLFARFIVTPQRAAVQHLL